MVLRDAKLLVLNSNRSFAEYRSWTRIPYRRNQYLHILQAARPAFCGSSALANGGCLNMCLSVWSASGRRGATIPARPSTNSPHPRAGGEGAGLARRYTSAAVHICSRRYGGQLFSTTDQAGPRDPPARQPAPPIRAAVSASWRHYAAPRGGSLNLRRLASSSLRRDDGVISAQISGNTTAEAAGRPGTDPACGPGPTTALIRIGVFTMVASVLVAFGFACVKFVLPAHPLAHASVLPPACATHPCMPAVHAQERAWCPYLRADPVHRDGQSCRHAVQAAPCCCAPGVPAVGTVLTGLMRWQ